MFNYLAVFCKSKAVGTNNNLLSPRPPFRSRVRVQAALSSMLIAHSSLGAHSPIDGMMMRRHLNNALPEHDNAAVVL